MHDLTFSLPVAELFQKSGFSLSWLFLTFVILIATSRPDHHLQRWSSKAPNLTCSLPKFILMVPEKRTGSCGMMVMRERSLVSPSRPMFSPST